MCLACDGFPSAVLMTPKVRLGRSDDGCAKRVLGRTGGGINSWVYDVGMAGREVKDGGPEKYSRQAQRHGWSRPMDGDGDLCV